MENKFEKYKCIICQDLLKKPVTLRKCFHEFCLECIQTYIKTKLQSHLPLECPLCRTAFKQFDYVMATDLQKEIENCKIKCKCNIITTIRKPSRKLYLQL